MTLDEAIKHAEEVADKKEREKQKWERWLETDSDCRAVAEKVSCELCAEEHRQLAEWLNDYKRLLEIANLPSAQPEIIRCKDCKYSHLTYGGDCKYCDKWLDDDDFHLTLYLDGDFYCGYAERRTDE